MGLVNMKKRVGAWLTHPNAALAARVMLGCVFIYASLYKIRQPDLFAETVYNYQLTPEVAVNLVAIWLPWVELFAGGLLVLGLWVRGSVLLLNGLLVLFLGALGISLARGLDIHCGCFGAQSGHSMSIVTLLRDSVFLLLGLYLFWLYSIRRVDKKFSLVRVLRRG
jgi:uncharacterized membrane protein YphA (DoxX/SURF4 family)